MDKHPFFATEGHKHIAIAFAVVVIAFLISTGLGILLSLGLIFILQFFRDPKRKITEGKLNYLSPADGGIAFAGPCKSPSGEDSIKISVFMNVFNVHSNRAPIAGKIIKREYRPGKFLNAALDKSSEQNEANTLVIKTEDGREIVVVQIAGLIARRIFCYVNEGDTVKLGQRYGFIRFGSRVDVFLPPDSQLRVRLGDHVTAGIDQLAVKPGSWSSKL